MNISMDLNASPLPEEDEENYGQQHVDDGRQVEAHMETSVQTLRRVCIFILCCLSNYIKWAGFLCVEFQCAKKS